MTHARLKRYRFLFPALLVLACTLPFVFLLIQSLATTWPYPDLWPSALSTDAWQQLMRGSMGSSFGLSLGISVLVALLSTTAGYVTGNYIAYHRHHRLLLFFAYVPFVMSPVILGTCLMYLYIKANLTGTISGVVLSHIMFAYGFSIVFFSAFWNQRMRSLEDLVYTLGGSVYQAYRHVLLPVSKNALLLCFFQTFLISWFQYGVTLLIGAGKVQTLPIKVYEFIGEANIQYAALASCLLVIPPAVLLWINKRFVFKPV